MTIKGYFIVIEGPDGVGKTTLASRLADRIRATGRDVLEVREPGGTPVAEAARKTVLDPALGASPLAELFLILAARADLVAHVIRPALEAGKIVVGDRYELSTWAYQVEGRQLPGKPVQEANRLATGGLAPDLTLVLDAPSSVLQQRMADEGKKPDRIEQAAEEVRTRIERAFANATGTGIVHVDATGDSDSVERAAWNLVERHIVVDAKVSRR
jgi:dTMP kinase